MAQTEFQIIIKTWLTISWTQNFNLGCSFSSVLFFLIHQKIRLLKENENSTSRNRIYGQYQHYARKGFEMYGHACITTSEVETSHHVSQCKWKHE